MNKINLILFLNSIYFISFLSCIKTAPVMIPRSATDILKSFVSQSQPIEFGDARCTYGGINIISWTDKNINDGVYTEGIDTDYSEKAVCFSAITGNTTTLSKPGDFKVIATDVVVGDTDCPQGGKKYESFIDVDGNNIYNSSIDTNYNAKKICNGLNGTASLSGANGVIITSVLASGSTQCPTGGNKSESFTDMNNNGTYESEIDTFYSVRYTCNGSNSVTLTSTIALGDSICPSGGTQVNTFTDINNNGTYESTIDKNSNTYKVCNGQKALVLSTILAAGDTTCTAGGTQLTTCIDSNGDAACTSGPDLNYAVQKICNGPGAGFLVITENPGSNCRAGGYRLDRFQDNNNNAVYDVGTDTGYTSTYICNGLNWLSRSTSFNAGAGTAGDNTACPIGGVRFEFGYDHVNSSNGTYNVGTDGVLDTIEIVASATAYSCNGAAGTAGGGGAGPLISNFQNDSEGTKARFYWEIVTGDGAAPNVKLAYSSTKAEIQAWNCEDYLSGVTVVTDFSNCTDSTYQTASSGSLTSNATCGFDLTTTPFNIGAWDYRYFKLCAQNRTSPFAQSITTFRVAGNVPAGMVMVHLDDWPIHEFANTTITPFTYAIDKWEGYLEGSGFVSSGIPVICNDTNCVSSSTDVLRSIGPTGQLPKVSMDWYASRQVCANRDVTIGGYAGGDTSRTIHLQTEMEQFVANYGTPDGQEAKSLVTYYNSYLGCNTDFAHDPYNNYGSSGYFDPGDFATKNCISRYGARDLIGNYEEYVDGYYENMNNDTIRQKSVYWGTANKVTTVISDAMLGYTIPFALGTKSYVQDWDYQNLLPKPPLLVPFLALIVPNMWDSPSEKFFNDMTFIQTTVPTPLVIMQDGGKSAGSGSGRFYKMMTDANHHGYARCAIVSP